MRFPLVRISKEVAPLASAEELPKESINRGASPEDRLDDRLDTLRNKNAKSFASWVSSGGLREIIQLPSEEAHRMWAVVISRTQTPSLAADILHQLKALRKEPIHGSQASKRIMFQMAALGLAEQTLQILHQRYGAPRQELEPLWEHATALPRPVAIGHRGFPSRHADNSIGGSKEALERGAKGLELDFCLTADGHVVLHHDNNPVFNAVTKARQAGLEGFGETAYHPAPAPIFSSRRKPVHQLTLHELKESHYHILNNAMGFWEPSPAMHPIPHFFLKWMLFLVPRTFAFVIDKLVPRNRARADLPMIYPDQTATFEELAKWLKDNPQKHAALTYIGVDVKIPNDPKLIEKFATEIDRIAGAYDLKDKIKFMCPDHDIVDALEKRLGPPYRYSRDVELVSLVHDADHVALDEAGSVGLPVFGVDGEEVYFEVLTRHFDRGEKVTAWTLNDPKHIRLAIGSGAIDGVITDRPDIMADILKSLPTGPMPQHIADIA